MQHAERKIVENINRGFYDETWLIPSGQTFTENQEESMRSMQKKQKVFVQAASEADEREACWVGYIASLQQCLKVLERLLFPGFAFAETWQLLHLSWNSPKEKRLLKQKDISKCGSVL